MHCRGRASLFQSWILRLNNRTETLAIAASIDEDGTILDRGPLGSGRFLFTVK